MLWFEIRVSRECDIGAAANGAIDYRKAKSFLGFVRDIPQVDLTNAASRCGMTGYATWKCQECLAWGETPRDVQCLGMIGATAITALDLISVRRCLRQNESECWNRAVRGV